VAFLTSSPLDYQQLIDSVMRPSDGALAFFAGVVRDHHDGRAVVSIDYEAYAPMAEQEIGRVVAAVKARYPQVAVAVQHRVGLVRVGEASVAIACASPHRGEAFDACRQVIDQLKQTVPIWKKEHSPDGSTWVGWQN
jgi:molybdopterin synthase catalytic subunit